MLGLIGDQNAFAWPPTYGTELNFTSPELQKNFEERIRRLGERQGQFPDHSEQKMAERLAKAIERKCQPRCQVIVHTGKFEGISEYKITFEDGYWVNISVDPSVVEIQTKPMTLHEIQNHAKSLNQMVFDVAKAEGLSGKTQRAHFNTGFYSAFGDSQDAFIKYFIDYANHPELASGALGKDFENGPPMSHLDLDQQEALAKIVEDYRAGKFRSAAQISRRIELEVYTKTPVFKAGYHYQAFGLKSVNRAKSPLWDEDRPFELRAIRHPKNAEEFALLAELQQKRLDYTARQTSLPVFRPRTPVEFSAEDLVSSFYLYVTEMGEDWNKYKDLMEPSLQGQFPNRFVTGQIKWSTPKQVDLVKRYLPEADRSEGVRKRLISAFAKGGAADSEEARKLLLQLTEMGASDFGYAQAAVQVVEEVAKLPEWKANNSLFVAQLLQDARANWLKWGPKPAVLDKRLAKPHGAGDSCVDEILLDLFGPSH